MSGHSETCLPAAAAPDGRLLSGLARRALACLPAVAPFLFVFLWSTGFIGARYGLPHAAPLSFLLVRYLAVIGLMLGLALLTGAPWPTQPRQWLRIAISGLLVHGTYLGGVYMAIANGLPLGLSSVIVGLQPLLTAAAAALLLTERITWRQWAGLALGLIGTVLVVSARLDGGFGFAGLPAAFAALLGITAGTLYQKRFCPNFDYRSGAVIQFIPCALATWMAQWLFEDFRVEWTGQFIFAVLWLALVLSVGAVGLLNYLIRTTGSATRLASLFYMVPPTTAVIAWLVFDETIGGLALLGMAVVVFGVYLARNVPAKENK